MKSKGCKEEDDGDDNKSKGDDGDDDDGSHAGCRRRGSGGWTGRARAGSSAKRSHVGGNTRSQAPAMIRTEGGTG